MARLKIATFNINGIRARLGALLEWLEREKPDVACLQELKAPEEAFPLSDIERLGYGAIWHGQKSWNGVAILARGAQPDERQRGLPDDPDGTQSRYLEADVHGLRVACLYLPNGNPWPGPKFDYKLAWFAQLRRRAAKLLKDGVPTVMCGDFNVVPTDELDIYNAKSWKTDALLQPESREAWFELLAQGWTDSIRAVHGDERIYTFWDYFRKHWERDAGLRIDHLLLSPTLAPTLRDAGVDRWVRGKPGASDHAPTWVLLDTASDRAGGAGRPSAKKAGAKRAAASGSKNAARSAVEGNTAPRPDAKRVRASSAAARKAGKNVGKKVAKTVTKNVAKKVAKNAFPGTRVAKKGSATRQPVDAGSAAGKTAAASKRTTASGKPAVAKKRSATGTATKAARRTAS